MFHIIIAYDHPKHTSEGESAADSPTRELTAKRPFSQSLVRIYRKQITSTRGNTRLKCYSASISTLSTHWKATDLHFVELSVRTSILSDLVTGTQ